jgi:hypothetical protein
MKRLFAILSVAALIPTALTAQGYTFEETRIESPVFPDLTGHLLDEDPIGTDNREPGDIPVDGGLSLLLAAGAAYGARRLRRRKKD